MRTIAFMNHKGGVGKTVTCVNMAAILANDYAKRVLVVDADSQANTTEFFGGLPGGACSLGDLLRRTDVNELIRPSNFSGVKLIGADDSLMDLDLSAVKSKEADVLALAKVLTAEAFSLRGMANLLRQTRNMRAINPRLILAGLLPTMVYRSEQVYRAMEILQESDFRVFPAIRKTSKVDDMTFAQRPLIKSSPCSAACVDYRRFVKSYLKGGADNGV